MEALGDNANTQKGVAAEELYEVYARRVYDQVNYYPADQEKQTAGIDFEIKKDKWARFYGVDVKANLLEDGTFYIENSPEGWLRGPNKKNDRVCHICAANGWAVEYDRRSMIETLNIQHKPNELLKMTVFDDTIKDVIRRFKVNSND